MKKIMIYILLIIPLIAFSQVGINANVESSWTYDFEASPTQFYWNGMKFDIYLKPDSTNFFGSFNLNRGDDNNYYVTDGEFEFKFDSNKITTFWKKKSVNTTDWINAFNNEKIGAVNGLKANFDISLFSLETYLVKRESENSSLFISQIRGIPFGQLYYSYIYGREFYTKYIYTDWRMFDFNFTQDNFQLLGEFGYSYEKGVFYLEDNYFIFLGNRLNYKDFETAVYLKYLSPEFDKKYLPDSFKQNVYGEVKVKNIGVSSEVNYSFEDNTLSFDKFSIDYIKNYLKINDFNYLYVGLAKNFDLNKSEIALNLPFHFNNMFDLTVSGYKKGMEDNWSNIKKYSDFAISANMKGNFMNTYYNLLYIFGNKNVEIEDSVVYSGGFSEVLYGSVSRGFGDVNFFIKGMYIYGAIERYKTLYAEAKYTGFSNSEIILSLGDGNFGASKNFSKRISLTVKTGF
ncbi:hypothetical protein XO10_06600 [Marinitoga sp. 1135]|uniref:Uncharacterized protein n=1 Tax=Marinitoga piezophila (strain DSM 14283 / JCM 11233 / KA3) TaxID=443254 RepID=H2J3C6_MARPK|nr:MULTISPECIES: hypothetical protein [Marinitoga]AEX85742.1 hypothetical protein Marpi_1339 [Marinitoga piezophila KA3]NUU95947.1 hypothetical protein [Marinitoga sp. 1135]NUU97858.1 hypothetical protein [Marinitoga sp. 1138]